VVCKLEKRGIFLIPTILKSTFENLHHLSSAFCPLTPITFVGFLLSVFCLLSSVFCHLSSSARHLKPCFCLYL
jgi:hypothetical protein